MSTISHPNLQIRQKRLFISYASEDRESAYHLFKDLENFKNSLHDKKSVEIFLDKESLEVGDRWKVVIEEEIQKSQYFILLLSNNSIKKNKYVQEELNVALEKAKKNDLEKYIIPISLDNCEIPESIQDLHVINLSVLGWERGFKLILKATKLTPDVKFPEVYWKNLMNDIAQGKCIPFLGESVLEFFNQINDQAFVTNQEIAKDWAEKYNYPLSGPYQLPKVAQFLAIDQANELFPKQTMSTIIGEMATPKFSSSPYNKSPYALLADLNFPIYVTTNYDHFMEDALKSQGKEPISEHCLWKEELVKSSKKGIIPAFKKPNKEYPTPQKPLVFHFHGSIDYPSTMVLTERDYFDFVIYTNQPEFEKEGLSPILRTVLAKSSLLFIGYSLDDLNFRSIFQGGLSFMSSVSKDRNSIAVMQFPSIENKTTDEENVVRYFEKYTDNMFKIMVYWGEPIEFIEELIRRWNEFNNKG